MKSSDTCPGKSDLLLKWDHSAPDLNPPGGCLNAENVVQRRLEAYFTFLANFPIDPADLRDVTPFPQPFTIEN